MERLPAAELTRRLADVLRASASTVRSPFIVAIDGRSGTGKSTFAARLSRELGARTIEGDDFYAGGVDVRHDTPAERVEACIDWRRQRPVLATLRRGASARWYPFDWAAFTGQRASAPVACDAAPLVILEGVYTGRPELSDLVDLRVLVRVPEARRMKQLITREGALSPWERQWLEAEDHYFATVATPERFDVVVDLA